MNEKVKKIVLIAIVILVIIIVGILIYMNIDIKKVDSTNENNEIVSHDPGMKTLKLTLIPMQQFIHFTLHLSVLV